MQNFSNIGQGTCSYDIHWFWVALRTMTFEPKPVPDIDDAKDWCNTTFGVMDESLNGRWFHSGTTFYFQNKKDRDWFILRWST